MTDKELLSQYQAAMVDIARTLGLEPNVGIGDPYYYSDMIIERLERLALDNNEIALRIKSKTKELCYCADWIDKFVRTVLSSDEEQ